MQLPATAFNFNTRSAVKIVVHCCFSRDFSCKLQAAIATYMLHIAS